ncbi:MAG: NAD(+)/NADH kinase [Sulfolobales archaeon]
MSRSGLIINPDAGKDVRRLLSPASYLSNFTKIELGKRVVLGLDSAGVDEILVMHDNSGLGEDVVTSLEGKISSKLILIPTRGTGTVLDTIESASKMRDLGVKSLVVVGGDGTLRAAFKGAPDVPLATVSAGTNNVTGAFYDASLVGYAAGLIAVGEVELEDAVRRVKLLEVFVNEKLRDVAVIDVAGVKIPYVGARAISDVESVMFAVFSKGEPTDVGLASILGFLRPTDFDEDIGFYVEFGKGFIEVNALIMPGVFKKVGIKKVERLNVGSFVSLPSGTYTLALDGERELEVCSSDDVKVMLSRRGPLLINVPKVLRTYTKNKTLLNV